ncbi:MAG: N-acetyl sugar amidotransferase, partial [Thermotogota bacterium]|nr:N-acetyl sugar amidotransferase [Thermotogota bacterium]
MNDIKTCKRCFLPNTYPGVSFNEENICNYCIKRSTPDYKKMLNMSFKLNKLDELKSIAKEIKLNRMQLKNKYDCIIGASGGFDSTYVIYIVKKFMGLNPLVVKY